jgi:hypothetical protein
VQAVTELKDQLVALGEVVSDLYFKDVLLANLDSSYKSIQNSLLAQPAGESDLTGVLSVISGTTYIQLDIKSAADNILESQVKQEPNDSAMAMRFSRTKGGSWRDKQDKKDHSQGKGGSIHLSSKREAYFEAHGGAKNSGKEDSSGRHWCDPMNENHCHRCGKQGHIAARCIHDMPPDIVKWVMAHPRSNEQPNVVNEISSLSDASTSIAVISSAMVRLALSARAIPGGMPSFNPTFISELDGIQLTCILLPCHPASS